MRQIVHALSIEAQPSAVYAALTTEAGLAGWWSTRVAVEPGEGGVIRFTFGGSFNPEMRQARLERDRRVEWRCVGGHANWQDNTFRFSLEARGGETLLMFSQDYARELPDEVYGSYNFNWGYYLNSLKVLCERGAGTPYSPS